MFVYFTRLYCICVLLLFCRFHHCPQTIPTSSDYKDGGEPCHVHDYVILTEGQLVIDAISTHPNGLKIWDDMTFRGDLQCPNLTALMENSTTTTAPNSTVTPEDTTESEDTTTSVSTTISTTAFTGTITEGEYVEDLTRFDNRLEDYKNVDYGQYDHLDRSQGILYSNQLHIIFTCIILSLVK